MNFRPLCKDIHRNVITVNGDAWGDEGKGKVLCFLAQWADIIVRSTGGNNAGHTVVYKGVKYPLHLVPTGIVRQNAISIMAPGMIVDLKVLCEEIRLLVSNGIEVTPDNLKISDRIAVTLPYNIVKDEWEEEKKGSDSIGTTHRGIGPTVESKAQRNAVRMIDIKKGTFRERIDSIFETAPQEIIDKYPKLKQQCIDYCIMYGRDIKDFICNTQIILNKAYEEDKLILYEGAQSFSLSLNHGYYPYCTSTDADASATLSAGCTGPLHALYSIGVFKAYTSRVGNGCFPTELKGSLGDIIRELGHEYGTTNGRPRRCGWLDLVQIKYAAQTNGHNCLAINHLDTIGKIGLEIGEILVCTKYRYKSNPDDDAYWEYIDYVPTDLSDVYRGTKIECKKFDGWEIPEGCKTYSDLPSEAKRYIEFIEDFVGVPIAFIGIGPKDEDMIVRGEFVIKQ